MRAPERARTSGIRNPSPISTSSPRDTTTSRPSPSAATARRTAAALLLTTSAASAPVARRSASLTCAWRDPRAPDSRSSSRFEYERPTSSTRARADGARGARPRFVWTITPVALSTRRREGVDRRSSSARVVPTTSPGSSPAAICSRARSRTVRAASTAIARGAAASASSASSRSTDGRSRRSTISV